MGPDLTNGGFAIVGKKVGALRPGCTALADHRSARKPVTKIKATLQVVLILVCRQQGASGSIGARICAAVQIVTSTSSCSRLVATMLFYSCEPLSQGVW